MGFDFISLDYESVWMSSSKHFALQGRRYWRNMERVSGNQQVQLKTPFGNCEREAEQACLSETSSLVSATVNVPQHLEE